MFENPDFFMPIDPELGLRNPLCFMSINSKPGSDMHLDVAKPSLFLNIDSKPRFDMPLILNLEFAYALIMKGKICIIQSCDLKMRGQNSSSFRWVCANVNVQCTQWSQIQHFYTSMFQT